MRFRTVDERERQRKAQTAELGSFGRNYSPCFRRQLA